MVGRILLGILLITPLAEAEPITADQLRRGANQYDLSQQKRGVSPSDLRSMLGILEGKDAAVYYKYKGNTYPGIQLPDGTLAPAIVSSTNQKTPGCLANNGKIYPADWVDDHLVCQLPKHEKALIPVEQDIAVARVNPNVIPKDPVRLQKYNAQKKSLDQAKPDQAKITSNASGQGQDGERIKTASRPVINNDPNLYIPPPRTSVSNSSKSFSIQKDKSKFGISFGTWVRAEIKRPVTNADYGEVEIILTETLFGRSRELPAQTVLYGYKSFNHGTNRLDVQVSRGTTPSGEEIQLSATIYSEDKEFSGLSGVLLRNRDKEVNNIAKNAALQTASVALSQLSPNNELMGTAYDSVADQAISNERRYVNQQQGAVIKVFPQKIYIRIDRSF